MGDIFQMLVFPWHIWEASELHRLLAETFPTRDEALEIAQKAGLQKSKLKVDDPLYFLWKDILEKASSKLLLRKLVEVAIGFLPDDHSTAQYCKALLDAKQPVMAATAPRGPNGAPIFISSSDKVSHDEALLYKDDLTLDSGKLLELVETLKILHGFSPSICHLITNFNGSIQHGTGFRIGVDKILTNWHVINYKGTPATAITAEFGYEFDEKGVVKNTIKIPCNATTVVSDKADDWAVITVGSALDNAWPIIRLADNEEPELKAPAYIIQHPEGQPKRIGYVRNQVSAFDDRVVHYLTDTKEGSSGAPVFNSKGKLIALHHVGGTPQQVTGLPPVKKNEGIRITRVIEGLKQQQVVI